VRNIESHIAFLIRIGRPQETRTTGGYAALGRIVASLDRKRLGQDTSGGRRSWSEAFSIRRLGGSRWCLRRTRCAMGFERHFGIQQVDGRPREKRVKIVVYVAKTGKSGDGRL